MTTLRTVLTVLILSLSFPILAQEGSETTATTEKAEKDKRPVRSPFACGTLLNQQTTVNLKKNALEMMMQHRFGTLANGFDDLWGIYGPANIRIGFDYGVHDRVQVGFGATKNGALWDFRTKVVVLQQTRSNSMPVSVSLFGVAGITNSTDTIRYQETVQRMSYCSQLIISHKINSWATVQVAPSYIHYNIVDSVAGTNHDNLALSVSGRFKVTPQSSVMIEYDYPLTNTGIEETETNPNLGLGWEIATSSHAFQIFVASANGILPQQNIVYNFNDYTTPKEGLIIGFNITRNWAF